MNLNLNKGDSFICLEDREGVYGTLIAGKKYRIIDIINIDLEKKQYGVVTVPDNIIEKIYWGIKKLIAGIV